MIKARPVAGDIAAGEAFLKELQPYVWRKYMDYAAIADVHSIKRQIHAHKGHGEIAVKGHNVKLGRGGIREIEFFVQTQQLIAGGRFPELRGRETVPMLGQLAERGWITAEARDCADAAILVPAPRRTCRADGGRRADAYCFPRTMADWCASRACSALPSCGRFLGGLPRLAAAGRAALRGAVRGRAGTFVGRRQSGLHRRRRRSRHAEDAAQLGFERPSDICRVIRSWHFGRYRATQSAEARERLTELTPALLKAFGETRRADEALIRFDEFLAGLPAGIQLFSLLQSNPALLKLVADDHGRRAPAGRHHHPPPACLRRPARSGPSGRTAEPRLSLGAACRLSRERRSSTRICSTGCAYSPPSRNSSSACGCSPARSIRRAPARRFPTSPI